MFFNYTHHVEETVQDRGKLNQFWEKWYREKDLIIPFYSTDRTTSHSMLKLLSDLTSRSPSYKACESYLIRMAFGEKLDIVRKQIPGFLDDQAEALDRADKLRFIENLGNLGIRLNMIRKTTIDCAKSWWQCGNIFLRIRAAKQDDVWTVTFKSVHYRNIALMNTKPTEDQLAVIVKNWDEDDWLPHRTPPVIVKVSTFEDPMGFKWTERKKGEVYDTVLHIKNRNDQSDIYGRPEILAIIEWMLAEIGYGDLSAKGNNGDLTAKLLLLMKEEPQENDPGAESGQEKQNSFKMRMQAVRQVTTTDGTHKEVKNVAGMTYYDEAPTVVKLNVNRDAAWYKQNGADCSSKIYEVMGCIKELTGNSQAKSGIGSNQVINLYMMNNETTVNPLQETWEEYWGLIFDQVFELTGISADTAYNIKFQDKIESLVDKLKEANKGLSSALPTTTEQEEEQEANALEAQQQTDDEDGNQDLTQ